MYPTLRSPWLLVCPLLCCSLLTGCGSGNSWQAYDYDDWSFAVEFPDTPEVIEDTRAGGGGMDMQSGEERFLVRSWDRSNGITYEVRVMRHEPKGLSHDERLAEMTQFIFSDEKTSKALRVNGNDILEVIHPYLDQRPAKFWYYTTPGNWFFVSATADSKEQLLSEDVKRFLLSFRLKPTADETTEGQPATATDNAASSQDHADGEKSDSDSP